jgi:hypothetical protein
MGTCFSLFHLAKSAPFVNEVATKTHSFSQFLPQPTSAIFSLLNCSVFSTCRTHPCLSERSHSRPSPLAK